MRGKGFWKGERDSVAFGFDGQIGAIVGSQGVVDEAGVDVVFATEGVFRPLQDLFEDPVDYLDAGIGFADFATLVSEGREFE